MSKAHIICGMTDSGKSTFVQTELIKKIPIERVMVFDVNDEYGTEGLISFEDFTDTARKKEHKMIIFEEATIFFNAISTNKELVDMLVRKKHTNNYIVLIFHSVRSIHLYIYDLINYVTLFKTNDSAEYVEQKFHDPLMTQAFLEVHENSDKHFYKTIKIN
jgi:hypothetical protein